MLKVLTQDVEIKDNSAIVAFDMNEAYLHISTMRKAWSEGGDFDLIAKVEAHDSHIPQERREKQSEVLLLKFNRTSSSAKKSTMAGTRKFVIGAVEEEVEEKCFCKKEHIDLRSKIVYQTQFDPRFGNRAQQDAACFNACKVILQNAGLSPNSAPNDGTVIQIASENSYGDKTSQASYLSINKAIAMHGLAYIDEQLEQGYPVLVGVDHKSGSPNTDKTTDHFVVIVGRGCTDNEAFYYFYEVGTEQMEGGVNKGKLDGNKLYVSTDGSLRGTPYHNPNRNYIVSQVRKNVLP